ncbi:MAG: ATP-binding protein [Candidatus Sericytochromatia bacterium]
MPAYAEGLLKAEKVSYYWDPGHQLQIAKIVGLPEQVWQQAPPRLAWGIQPETLWLRIAVTEPLPPYPLLWLHRANLDKVCLYQKHLQRWDKQCRGTLDPEAQVKQEHEILNSIDSVFKIEPVVPSAAQTYWYLKVASHNWLTLPLEVISAQDYRSQRRFQVLSDFAAMGAFFAVIVYNLVLLFLLKESVHLWHALIMGCWGMYWFGFIFGYERMMPLTFQYYLHDSMFAWVLVVALIYLQAFLRFTQSEISHSIQRVVRGLQIFVMLGLPLLFLQSNRLSIYHGHVLSLILPLFLVGGALWSWRFKKPITGFYFLSWMFFFAGLLSFSLMVSGRIDFDAVFFHALSWLQFLSMLLIALIFALKIQALVRSREALLLSNLHLAQGHERHLVEQVQLRTQELELTLEELKQSNQTKDQLFAILAHDLRGPFSNLWMLMGLLEQKALDPEQLLADVLPGLKERIKSISTSLDDMLLWAQEELNGYPVQAQWLDPSEILAEVCALYAVAAEQKHISLSLSAIEHRQIKIDPNHLRLILRNLLQNALKFTPVGGKIVLATALAENGDFLLSIQDSGLGMEPDQIARLLSGQRQVSRVGTAGETGMGIGMQLCKAYLKANQAQIQIYSQNKLPQRGTRVELYFKCQQLPSLSLIESPTVEEVLG